MGRLGGRIAIFLVVMFVTSLANARVIRVARDGSGNYTSIKEALRHAQEGDTIEVGPGFYEDGNLLIKGKGLKLIGKGNPVIQGEKTGTAVTLTGEDILFKGFVVRGGGRDLTKDDSGLMFKHCTRCVVEDCKFFDNLFGCYFYQSDYCVFRNNLIEGRKYEVQEERGNGIHLWDSAYYLIEGNEIRYARDGIYISFSNYGMIRDNWIHHTRYGLHYMYSKKNAFEWNVLTENVAGAAVMYSKYMKWNYNVFAHNRGFRAYGVLWQDVRHSECLENLVIDNSIGLYFDQAGYSVVRGNVVMWNDLAAVLLENSELNTIYENNFIDNISNVQLRGGTQKGRNNRFYKDGRGNYWSDYRGYDLDGDGVGDVPHVLQNIFEFMIAFEPAYQLYLFSPAAQAIALAEKVFPVIEVSHEAIDNYPLMKPVETPALRKLLAKLREVDRLRHMRATGGFGRVILGVVSGVALGISLLGVYICNRRGRD